MTEIWAYFMITDGNKSKADCKLCEKEEELQYK